MADVVKSGHQGLKSDDWYVDSSSTWDQFYILDPLTNCSLSDPLQTNGPCYNITDPTQQQLVLGGEICAWGEKIDDTNIQEILWPTASAVAERLWSSSSFVDVNAALPRILEHRCRMKNRGVPAVPITAGHC